MNNELQWTYIKGTIGKYIILSDGMVFSGKHMDYLKLQERNTYYYVRLQYIGDSKPKNRSIYHLLSEYFPNSLSHEEYYRNIERRKQLYGY